MSATNIADEDRRRPHDLANDQADRGRPVGARFSGTSDEKGQALVASNTVSKTLIGKEMVMVKKLVLPLFGALATALLVPGTASAYGCRPSRVHSLRTERRLPLRAHPPRTAPAVRRQHTTRHMPITRNRRVV